MAVTKKQAEATKTEVATVKEAGLPSADFNFGNDLGAGMEGADKDSFAIPFLTVLQKISPQVDEADAKYVEGAKGSMFFNTVTQELWEGADGVIFIPCVFQRRFLRWGPRGTSEGGFKGEFLPEIAADMRQSGEVQEMEGKLVFPRGDGLVDPKKCDVLSDTRNHFGLIYDPETGLTKQVLLSLTSTQIKKSKQLMAMLSEIRVKGVGGALVQPPTWATMYKLTTVGESNDKGSWYGIKITALGFVPNQEVYDAGKAFHELLKAGGAKVDYNQHDGGMAGADVDADGGGKF